MAEYHATMDSSTPPPSAFRLHPSSTSRIAIIGGGITGLAAAHRITELRPHADVKVFEAADRLGGVIDTVHRDGLLIERSADNFLTKLPAAVALCRRLGIADQLLETDETRRRALVVHDGELLRVPDGFFLMSPRKLWPILRTPLLSPLGKLRLLAEPWVMVPAAMTSTDESVASFAFRRLGREVFERLVQPLVAGIYTADAEKLSMAATMPEFLAYERQSGSLLVATLQQRTHNDSAMSDDAAAGPRYAFFAAPKNGMSSLIAALAARLPAHAVYLNTSVTHIEQLTGNKWKIEVSGVRCQVSDSPSSETEDLTPNPQSAIRNRQLPFDALILAIPAPAAARLLAPMDSELAGELAAIEYAGCAVVSFGFTRDQIAHPLDGFGFVVPYVEGRRMIAASFASLKFAGRAPQGQVLIRVFIGGALQPELVDLPDGELRRLALDELRELLHLTGDPLITDIARWPASMPQYQVGHLDRIARMEQLAARHPGLALAGNAYHGVGIPQCIASGESAAEQLLPCLETTD